MTIDIIIEYSSRGMAHLVTIIPVTDRDGNGSSEEPIYDAAGSLGQAFDTVDHIISNHFTEGEVEPKDVSDKILWRRVNDNYWSGTVKLLESEEVS